MPQRESLPREYSGIFQMQRGKVVKYINLSIAVLLVVVLFAAYWIAYRPLARTSGEITAPVSEKATVARDAIGVPHIQAASWEDAIFLQGYVTAQDRLWQMDGLRRLAAGELSEIVGPSALELDREARRLRMRRMAEEIYKTLPDSDRSVLAVYARGVNYFIETHRGKLPLEFTLLQYDPRLWTIADSLLCGLQMYRNLTTTWREELQKAAMLETGDRAKVDFLFPSRIGGDYQPGSNAWALSGKHTADGKPILANDPHLEWGIPSTWYQVHLRAPGLDVTGVSLPGVPCVIVGHNQRIAWGVTNLGFDVEDLYVERLDPRSGRYLFKGQVEQARSETEWIAVKGARPIEFRQWITRHGPVTIAEGNRLLALRWSAAEPGSFQFPFLDLNRANNWTEFTAALARFPGPGQNFVYADVDGNIGYHATGKLPIRKNYDGDVPVDGSSGEYEWDGFIPFDQLPTFYNPPQGWVITANQNPFPDDYPYRVHGSFASPYRSQEIRSLLTSRGGWKPDQMLVVEKDVYSAFLDHLAKMVVAAYDRSKRDPNLSDAVTVLRGWNGQMEKHTAAPMLISIVYQQLRKRMAESASPGKADLYNPQMAPAVLADILDKGAHGWFQDEDSLLLRALSNGIEDGRKTQGSHVKRWNYGTFNQLTIRHPVGDKLPLLGPYFNVGPVEMSGSSTTIKQTTLALGPSMRFIADVGDWDRSLNNITIGQSGQFLSSHYKDQWNSYYTGSSFPMQFQHVDAKQTLTFLPK